MPIARSLEHPDDLRRIRVPLASRTTTANSPPASFRSAAARLTETAHERAVRHTEAGGMMAEQWEKENEDRQDYSFDICRPPGNTTAGDESKSSDDVSGPYRQ